MLRIKRIGLFMAIITMGILLAGCSNEDSEKKLVGDFRHKITSNLSESQVESNIFRFGWCAISKLAVDITNQFCYYKPNIRRRAMDIILDKKTKMPVYVQIAEQIKTQIRNK